MTIQDLLEEVKKYTKIDEARLRAAFDFAQKAHAGQTRMSGEPYITHPLGVAMLLTKYKADEESLMAALLHDVVEDSNYALSELEKHFGHGVAKMVDTLTKLPHAHMGIHEVKFTHFDSKIESIRKIFEVMQEDVRVIVIKLCDRLHNMQTLSHFRVEKQKRIAQETLDIFVKIADRLSIQDLKEQLEELSYRYLFPESFALFEQKKKDMTELFHRNVKNIQEKIHGKEILKTAKAVMFRQVIPYDMLLSGELEELEIINEVLIVLPEEKDCYLAVRDLHSIWKNIRGTFRDYISLPKSNGYQALETSLIKPDGSIWKFVMQTQKMYEYARNGVILECFAGTHTGKKVHLPWVESLKRIHKETKHKSADYLQALESDILKGSIIVYTEDNKTLFLPPESSALDAAFFCLGKKAEFVGKIFINDRARDLATFVHEGDKIRFVLEHRERLDADWFEKVNTVYSRSMIYDIVHDFFPQKKVQFGERLLQKELNKRGLGYVEEIDETNLKKSFKGQGIISRQDLYGHIADGMLSVQTACDILFARKSADQEMKKIRYELEMELIPGKYHALSSLLVLFDRKEVEVHDVHSYAPRGNGVVVKVNISFPYVLYDSFLKSIRGLSDMRFVNLQDVRKIQLSKGLIVFFMILVALDPVVAYFLLNTLQVHFMDLLTIRFSAVFLVTSGLLLLRGLKAHYVKESPIRYWNWYFFLSTLSLFSTAFFTYLALGKQVTPFFYQFSIYVLFFPFMALYLKQYSRFRILLYILFILGLSSFYLSTMVYTTVFDPTLAFYTLMVSVSFTVYTHSSIVFQQQQHIHRRYLSFFATLSLYAGMLSLLPHFFRESFQIPSFLQFGASFFFSVLFILIPYFLYYIISGVYGYTVKLWRTLVFILLIVIAGEVAILGQPINILELAIAGLFIFGYYAYSEAFKQKRIE